jgi:hypothetical protein
MGLFSVLVNIFTLLIIGIVLYMGYNLYITRPDMNDTATDVLNGLLAEPASVTHAFFTEPALGDVGQFKDYDWDRGVGYTNLGEE